MREGATLKQGYTTKPRAAPEAVSAFAALYSHNMEENLYMEAFSRCHYQAYGVDDRSR